MYRRRLRIVSSAGDDQHRQPRREHETLGKAVREDVMRRVLPVVADDDEVGPVLVREVEQVGDDIVAVDNPKFGVAWLCPIVDVSLREQRLHRIATRERAAGLPIVVAASRCGRAARRA